MEDKNIIYNDVNKNITPIDTSTKDLAFEADLAKTRRQLEERDMAMNQPIDTSTKDLTLKAELERARRVLQEYQDMYQNTEEPHKHR